jgi:hypothetical protein
MYELLLVSLVAVPLGIAAFFLLRPKKKLALKPATDMAVRRLSEGSVRVVSRGGFTTIELGPGGYISGDFNGESIEVRNTTNDVMTFQVGRRA